MTTGAPLRDRRRLVWRALVGYGVVGLAVAGLALIVLVIGLGRLNAVGDRLRDDVGGVSALLERTADGLDRAATTAGSFTTTIERSSTALTSAAEDLRAITPRLRDIEARANGISILGSQPLAPLAGLFGEIAVQIGDLDAQLDGISSNLTANQMTLAANTGSLTELARETRALAGRLEGDALGAVVDDARWLMVALLGISALGAAVPAVGALAAGLWLRRAREGGPSLAD